MNAYRNLQPDEIDRLESQGCVADDWSELLVVPDFRTSTIHRCRFTGKNYLGLFSEEILLPGGVKQKAGLYNAWLHDCRVGDQACITDVRGYIAGYDIGDHVLIASCDRIYMEGESTFGNGVQVDVLDETGGRQLLIYDRLSAHTAYLMAFYRYYHNFFDIVSALIGEYAGSVKSARGSVGSFSRIVDTGQIINVRIGPHALITGASRLQEGSVNSNIHDGSLVGNNVVAERFIISSGTEVSDHAVVTNCFVGQGCVLSKHYSAINSLFFSNCQGFNGEACSVFAGPFTVSHHKSTLLIAGLFSFCNAGSGSNQSNHMYKLGPIHHGIVERGSKTTSDSYLLWPARIGPFTLVMGRHYKNNDTSDMPFSYLIENKDESWLAPGINLRSVGTIRDAMKWPRRDRRKDPELLDSINFNLLSPFTIQRMVKGKQILGQIRQISGETTETYTWETTFISRHSLLRGIELYDMAIVKFLGNSLISRIQKGSCSSMEELLKWLKPETDKGEGDWIDACGLIAPKNEVKKLLRMTESGEIAHLEELENALKSLHREYYEMEWTWASALLEETLGKKLEELTSDDLISFIGLWKNCVTGLDKLLYEDARKEFKLSAMTGFGMDGDQRIKEQDFMMVRGTFENNRFVTEVVEHIRKKSELADKITEAIQALDAL